MNSVFYALCLQSDSVSRVSANLFKVLQPAGFFFWFLGYALSTLLLSSFLNVTSTMSKRLCLGTIPCESNLIQLPALLVAKRMEYSQSTLSVPLSIQDVLIIPTKYLLNHIVSNMSQIICLHINFS